MSEKDRPEFGTEENIAVEDEVTTPKMYKVLLLNDDYTPMDFVVWILQNVFHKAELEAETIMLQVHTQGSGVCGVFSHDIAQTKVHQVKTMAMQHEHPLECVMEPE